MPNPRTCTWRQASPCARLARLEVRSTITSAGTTWARCANRPLAEMDVLLMRVDPPVTMGYMYQCYLLEYAEARGVAVYNSPAGLRAINEKLYTQYYTGLTPHTLVSRDSRRILDFLRRQGEIILKPLNLMGGQGIIKLNARDAEAARAVEAATGNGRSFIMAQEFLPRVTQGDRRVLVIDGEPWGHVAGAHPAGE